MIFKAIEPVSSLREKVERAGDICFQNFQIYYPAGNRIYLEILNMICILEITFWDSKEREPELKKGIIQVKLKKKKSFLTYLIE